MNDPFRDSEPSGNVSIIRPRRQFAFSAPSAYFREIRLTKNSGKMAKFSTKVSARMGDILGRIKLAHTKNSGLAAAYALHLARLKPDHPVSDFGVGGERSANLTMDRAEVDLFEDFRSQHEPVLDKNIDFFKQGLSIGCSLYKDGYRLSQNINHSAATLVPPAPSAATPEPVK